MKATGGGGHEIDKLTTSPLNFLVLYQHHHPLVETVILFMHVPKTNECPYENVSIAPLLTSLYSTIKLKIIIAFLIQC